MRIMERKKSVKNKFLVSYLIILILPLLLLGTWGYWWMSTVIKEQTEKFYISTLKQVIDSMDNSFQGMNAMTQTLSESPWVQRIAAMEGSNIDYSRVTQEQLTDYATYLQNYQSINTMIERIAIIFNTKKQVLTSKGLDSFDWFFTKDYAYANMTVADWEKSVSQYTSGQILRARRLSSYERIDNVVSYVKTIPTLLDQTPRATILIGIKESRIKEQLNNTFQLPGSSIYIMNGPDSFLTGQNMQESIQRKLQYKTDKKVVVEQLKMDDGSASYAFYAPSKFNDWYYITVVPKAVVLDKVNYFNYATWILIALILVSGIIASYFMAFNNYRPIRRLIDNVQGELSSGQRKDGEGTVKSYYEYDVIKSTFDQMKLTRQELESKVNDYLPMAVYSLFIKLLYNTLSSDQIEYTMRMMHIGNRNNNWTVAVIYLPNAQADTTNLRQKISQWTAAEGEELYIIELENGRFAVVVNTDNGDEMRNALKEIKKKVFANESWAGIVTGIGSPYSGLEGISASYREAVIVINHTLVTSDNSEAVLSFNDISSNNELRYWFPAEKQQELQHRLRMGDFDKVEPILDQLLRANFEHPSFGALPAQCLLYDLISTALKVPESQGMGKMVLNDEGQFPVISTVNEIKAYVYQLYKEICTMFKERRKLESAKAHQDILDYIDLHYCFSEFSLNALAEHFGMSASQMSKLFKELTGMTFVDYLTKKRITTAKSFMAANELTLEELGKKVGYENTLTFRRAFKKVEGVNPSEFRDMSDELQ